MDVKPVKTITQTPMYETALHLHYLTVNIKTDKTEFGFCFVHCVSFVFDHLYWSCPAFHCICSVYSEAKGDPSLAPLILLVLTNFRHFFPRPE